MLCQVPAGTRTHQPSETSFSKVSLSFAAPGVQVVHAGDTGTVQIDIARILRLWGSTTGDSMPRAIILGVFAEGFALGEMEVKGRAGAGAPQLRVTYVTKYEAGVP